MYEISSNDNAKMSEVRTMLDDIGIPYTVKFKVNESDDFLIIKEFIEENYKGVEVKKEGE